MNTTLRNMMMGLTLAASVLMCTPTQAQRRNPSGATISTQSSEPRSSQAARGNQAAVRNDQRQHVATAPSQQRNNQGMNNGRTRPETNNGGGRRPDMTRPTNQHGTATTQHNFDRNRGNDRPNGNGNGGNFGNNDRNRPNGNGGNFGNNDRNRPNGNGGNFGNNDRNRPNGNGNHRPDDRNRPDNRGGNYGHRPDDRNRGGNYGHRPDDRNRPGNYGHRPDDRYRPDHNRGHNAYRDQYSWNYRHNNWGRPLPPPARAHRPAPYYHVRPHVPQAWRPYHGAPVIDRILGITFGTRFGVSLNYLYTNGYSIDGYDNNVVYLRNVNMLNLNWPDVMLCYDDNGYLYNAQFIHSSYYNDRSRYNRLYHDLCAAYGTPIDYDSRGYTWFGGNNVGYVTLSTSFEGSRYYTNLYVGN